MPESKSYTKKNYSLVSHYASTRVPTQERKYNEITITKCVDLKLVILEVF